MSQTKADFWVGLFVLLGLFALGFLAFKAGNLSTFNWSSASYTLTASFDNVGGLKPRAPVKSAGVVVGRVERIDFDNQSFRAVAVLSMNPRFVFPKDSSASILTAGLLGEQYIGLVAGSDDADLVDQDPIRFTQSAIVLEQLISRFLFSSAEKQGSTASSAPTAAP